MKAIVWKNIKPAPTLETISTLATKQLSHLGNFDIIAVKPVSAYVTESTPVSSYEVFLFRIIIKGLKDANSSLGHSVHLVNLSTSNISEDHFRLTLSSALKLFNAKTTGSFR